VAIPLVAATYAAPLSFITSPDFALWMVGPTGSLKSELAALSQRHFGRFDRKTLPGSWTSTENALEARLFTVKDAVAVIDDYAPNADSRAQQELEKRAQRIIRGIGNRASRGRLRADLSQQPDRPPRGLVICTGEDLPTGHSIQARLVIIEVDRERLNLDVITDLQASDDRLAHAMRGYIEWLQPAIPQLKEGDAGPARASARGAIPDRLASASGRRPRPGVLHGCARTTPRIRSELQGSKESTRTLARRYGLNPKTVAKWRRRKTIVDGPMGPKVRQAGAACSEESLCEPSS